MGCAAFPGGADRTAAPHPPPRDSLLRPPPGGGGPERKQGVGWLLPGSGVASGLSANAQGDLPGNHRRTKRKHGHIFSLRNVDWHLLSEYMAFVEKTSLSRVMVGRRSRTRGLQVTQASLVPQVTSSPAVDAMVAAGLLSLPGQPASLGWNQSQVHRYSIFVLLIYNLIRLNNMVYGMLILWTLLGQTLLGLIDGQFLEMPHVFLKEWVLSSSWVQRFTDAHGTQTLNYVVSILPALSECHLFPLSITRSGMLKHRLVWWFGNLS